MRSRSTAVMSFRNLGLLMVLACAGHGHALAADGPVEKIPADLKHWQLTATTTSGPMRPVVGPISVFSDGKCEFEPHKSQLSEADRSAILAMVRALTERSTFKISNGILWDASEYEFDISSGSRAIHVRLYPDGPAKLGIYEPVDAGIQVLNRVIESHKIQRVFQPPDPYGARKPDPSPGEIVPPANPNWRSVWVEFVAPGERIRLDVGNPRHEEPRDALWLSRYGQFNKSYPVSHDERVTMFDGAREIVNGFTLRDDDVAVTKKIPRCVVGIRDQGKAYSVEFPIDDRVPKAWRAYIQEVSKIRRKKDETLPVFGGEPAD